MLEKGGQHPGTRGAGFEARSPPVAMLKCGMSGSAVKGGEPFFVFFSDCCVDRERLRFMECLHRHLFRASVSQAPDSRRVLSGHFLRRGPRPIAFSYEYFLSSASKVKLSHLVRLGLEEELRPERTEGK